MAELEAESGDAAAAAALVDELEARVAGLTATVADLTAALRSRSADNDSLREQVRQPFAICAVTKPPACTPHPVLHLTATLDSRSFDNDVLREQVSQPTTIFVVQKPSACLLHPVLYLYSCCCLWGCLH